mmetsp:Transcript_5881/g.17724  ORF Transcript_5881/g.17724 Transcript_5881/m.17724 type:complete len:455 (+) Transcript_5881:45-1409(+)
MEGEGVREMEMDELFLERQLGGESEYEEEDLYQPSLGRAALYPGSLYTAEDEDDASMLDELEEAEYVPSSSLPANNPYASGRSARSEAASFDEEDLEEEAYSSSVERREARPPTVSDFKIIRVIGKGSFGKVFLARRVSNGAIYAMKVLKKENIVKRNQVEHTKTERSVLGYVRHPFVVGLHAAFQTSDKLFFVLDYCAGGELFCHLQKLGKFPEGRARFYTAELTLALEHVHALGVVYRDLKPENVLLDARGHVRLTDFGLSKEGVTSHHKGATSFCGTPEYLAPEILARRGHGRAVDWWSLGALLFEMLTGLPPFYSRDREQLFEGIKRGHLAYPAYLTAHAKKLLRSLLKREPSERLGSGQGDADEIKAHPFFAPIDFEALLDGAVPPPWTPHVVGSLDTSQFDREFTSLPIHSPPSLPPRLLRSKDDIPDETFAGFTFTETSAFPPDPRR